MEGLVRLKIIGLEGSPYRQGAFMLLLKQVDGPYVLRLVIGTAEAQSISIKLQGFVPPRPLTHDLFESFMHAFGIVLQNVYIYKVEDGIYHSEMRFTDGKREVVFDCRTSDAIAIALRTNSPIFTTQEILQSQGFVIGNDNSKGAGSLDSHGGGGHPQPKLENLTVEELKNAMQQCIEREEYEKAAEIKKILDRKQNKQ